MAVAGAPVVAWRDRAWRMHKRRYRAEDPGRALGVSGHYNQGLDRFDEEESFAGLYLATGPEICLGEVYRHITPELLTAPNGFCLSELSVEVGEVLNRRNSSGRLPGREVWGLLAPSATRLGDDRILFPETLRVGSRIETVSSREPRLYVER